MPGRSRGLRRLSGRQIQALGTTAPNGWGRRAGAGAGMQASPLGVPFHLTRIVHQCLTCSQIEVNSERTSTQKTSKRSGHLQMLSLEQRRWILGYISRAHDVCMGRHNCLQAGVVVWQRNRHSDRARSQLPDATG